MTGNWTTEWLQWIINPRIQTLQVSNAIPVSEGGTGTGIAPNLNQILIGDGVGGYAIVSTLPVSALPAFNGDAISTAGTNTLTLANVNTAPGSFGSSSQVGAFTVNAKGQITVSSNIPIDSTIGNLAVGANLNAVGGFGCNTKTAQAAASSGSAVPATGSTNVTPFGYTTAAQADRIVALLNTIQAALIANGILS